MTYLDHAATTPALPEVIDAVAAVMADCGNPSSLHGAGRAARRRVEEARESIAADLGARPIEVIFTSGGTESNNLALIGMFRARRRADPVRRRLLTAATEHHAVIDTAERLAADEGAQLHWLAADEYARTSPQVLETDLDERTALVSLMWANNEVGTVNPIRELAETAHEHGVPMHTDAVQALGQLPVDFTASGVDAMTVTGHKVGGPVGVGVLLARRDLQIEPIAFGGGQERAVRSGTLDVAGIAGLAVAVREAVRGRVARAHRLTALRERLIAGVLDVVDGVTLSGDSGRGTIDGGPSRLPGNAHLRFAGCEGDALLMLLDAAGIECSTGSACTAGVARPSHVLLAMGCSEPEAGGALRFTLGHTSTEADVAVLLAAIGPAVARARAAASARRRVRI